MNFYVLAGGKSRRMGENKALLELDGKTIIERVISAIPKDGNTVKIVTNSFEDYVSLGFEMLEDRFRDVGPLAGIHAGLFDASEHFSFFLACDLPFLSEAVIREIISKHHGQDIFGVKSDFGWEPLCAIYSKACIPYIEKQILKGEFSLKSLPEFLESSAIDLGLKNSLFNLNSPKDWVSIKK